MQLINLLQITFRAERKTSESLSSIQKLFWGGKGKVKLECVNESRGEKEGDGNIFKAWVYFGRGPGVIGRSDLLGFEECR